MYFTRMELDSRLRETHAILASPHRMHGAVNTCFPDTKDPGRVLWRLDETNRGTFVYLLSGLAPDPSALMERYGVRSPDGWQARDYDAVLSAVESGREFAFRLRGNPTHSVPLPGQQAGTRTKRLGHVTVAQQRQWFLKRALSWGIDVGTGESPTMEIIDRRLWRFKRQEHLVTVATAVFEGRLKVIDAEAFRNQLVTGFGGAKVYGCGLLTLAPPRP